MAHHLQKRWIFTWLSGNASTNNIPDLDEDGKQIFYELPSIDRLKNLLDSISQEAVFQLERGEDTGRYHYQGRFTLLGTRKGKIALLTIFSEIGNIKLLTINHELNYDHDQYCTKNDTRIEGPFYCGIDSYKVINSTSSSQLRTWQKDLTEFIKNNLSYLKDRKVLWIQNPDGGAGKSTYIKHLRIHGEKQHGLKVKKLPLEKPDRLRSAIVKILKTENVDLFCFDFTKTKGEDTSYKDLFQIVEEIKNGYVIDTMYGKFNEAITTGAVVAIFTNERFIDYVNYLSYDRWIEFEVGNPEYPDQLVKREVPDLKTNKPTYRSEIPYEEWITFSSYKNEYKKHI